MKKLCYYALTMAIMAYSCKKDDETPSQLNPSEAKTSLSKLSTDMSTDIVDLTQSKGVDAIGELVSLLDLNDPFGGRMMGENESKNWFKKNARLLKTIFTPKSINSRTDDHGFDFEGNWGDYNWNPTTEQFDKTHNNSQIIVIKFPEQGSTTNNIVLRLTEYSDQLVEDELEHYYLPTSLKSDLSINTVKQIDLSLTAQYDINGEPEQGNISLYLNPFTFTLSFEVTNTSQSTGKASLKKGEETIASVDIVVNYLTAAKEDINDISGFVQFRNVKIQGSVDVNGIESASNPDPNKFVKLALYDGTKKLGDIVFVSEMVDGEQDDVPYVKYSDGTKEKVEVVLQPIFDELENLGNKIDSWG